MRLLEMTLEAAFIHERLPGRGALGSRPEAFSTIGVPVRASVLGEGGGISETDQGLRDESTLRLLVPDDTPGRVGDRVIARGKLYEIVSIDEWTAHREFVCKARIA